MGIDSLLSVQLAQEFEQWLGCHISPVAAWSYPTPAAMADFLLQQLEPVDPQPETAMVRDRTGDASEPGLPDDLKAFLDQLEQMDEVEAQALLNR